MNGGKIEVLSEYTREAQKHGRIKYGVAIYSLDAATGGLQSMVSNELTTTLLKDTGINGKQVMTNSYLYVSHAARTANGHWVLAMQQFTKLPVRPRLFKNKLVNYELRNICFAEMDEGARVVSSYTEKNEPNPVRLPKAFFTNPHNSGVYLTATSVVDVGYFVAPDATNEQVSFVFTDVSKRAGLTVGNVVFRDGRFRTDKFRQGEEGSFSFAGVLPARYGHTYLITFNALTGKFDFDNIKFNN
jgi:hypothetical protein